MIRSFNKALKSRKRAGFTLIELLVVVLILGILLAVAIPLYLSSVRNSAQQAIKANMKTIATAAQAHKVQNGAYPAAIGDLVGTGKDLEQTPLGPRAVTYSLAVASGVLTVSATEAIATDAKVINKADADTTASVGTYNLSTGTYAAFD